MGYVYIPPKDSYIVFRDGESCMWDDMVRGTITFQCYEETVSIGKEKIPLLIQALVSLI